MYVWSYKIIIYLFIYYVCVQPVLVHVWEQLVCGGQRTPGRNWRPACSTWSGDWTRLTGLQNRPLHLCSSSGPHLGNKEFSTSQLGERSKNHTNYSTDTGNEKRHPFFRKHFQRNCLKHPLWGGRWGKARSQPEWLKMQLDFTHSPGQMALGSEYICDRTMYVSPASGCGVWMALLTAHLPPVERVCFVHLGMLGWGQVDTDYTV